MAILEKHTKLSLVYLISILFIGLNLILVAYEFYWLLMLPIFLFFILLYIISLDKLLLIITFLTPIAINIRDFDFGVSVSLPTEPLMFGVLLLFVIRLFYENQFDIKITRHPISIAIIFNLVWILITSITSELPIVSFKYLLSRLWFVVPFYFIATQLFRDQKNIRAFIWTYLASLIIVIVYTTYNHYLYGFEEKAGHWVMTPFYNDHTAYGAILSLFIPVVIGFIFDNQRSNTVRFISFISSVILIIAIVLSYSRAAWISLLLALVVLIIVQLRIKFSWVLIGIVVFVMAIFTFQNEIVMKLEKNKQSSSANLAEHVQSISNISSDASNLERINRWQSAIRMFKERPFIGWGPGTYQFVYAPFQQSKDKTIISTNAGDKGNAHSEYIGPLAEEGVIGMLTFLIIIVLTIYTALKVFKTAGTREVRVLSLLIVLGLITYYTHGILNNFLDTDKASVPFWGFTAIIVALDVYHSKTKESSNTIL